MKIDGRKIFASGVRMTLSTILGFMVVFVVLIFSCQRRMIYYPSDYPETWLTTLPEPVERIKYRTDQGEQVAWYWDPQAVQATDRESTGPQALPPRIWFMFNGNATVALSWLDLIEDLPNDDDGFLMFDYPGYGVNEGRPTRQNIEAASTAATRALADYYGIDLEQLGGHLGILGQSIGTGAALDLAVNVPVNRIILISPFTTLVEMARKVVGWPLNQLVLDRYNNRARLEELGQREVPPEVVIVHGSSDNIIPVEMGRELAESFPELVEYHEVKGGDHNYLIDSARPLILSLLAGNNAKAAKGGQSETE